MQQVTKLYHENKSAFNFLLKGSALYLLWQLLYYGFLSPYGNLDPWLTAMVADHSTEIINTYFDSMPYMCLTDGSSGKIVCIDDKVFIGIAHSCNGQVLYPIYCGFLLLIPGSWWKKLAMVIMGSLTIYMANILRVIALLHIQLYYPQYLDISHHYIFTFLVYSIIFMLWLLSLKWLKMK
ncbi:exosortase/archaeosortase family protein [Persicobacter sp. CCB-QB2]|uniref:exosortase/archaeosortase family protein n=1 Tax=Persicobacter sp. CCB-QB2 TaxID=1561025 RepID=UPI0006A964B4|nr:exosortase/archaeosortase family protein [Persicobacter sp. CCB-QB2]